LLGRAQKEAFAWLESAALSTWIRESPSPWAYPLVLTLHTTGLGVLVGANWAVALRLLGFAPRIPLAPLAWLFPLMWVGFWINAVSGVGLFIADATVWTAHPAFIVKLMFVAVGMGNLWLLRTSAVFREPAGLASETVPRKDKILARASLVIWASAIVAGRLAGRYTAYQ